MSTFKSIPIGKVLQEYGYITEDQVQEALAYQKDHKEMRLGEILIDQGYITEKQMLQAIGDKLNMERVEIGDIQVDSDAVAQLPKQLAEQYLVLPVALSDRTLTLVVNDPLNFYGLEDIRQTTGKELEIKLSEKTPLSSAIQYYYSELSAQNAAKKANFSISATEDNFDLENINLEDDDEAPIINLMNSLIQRAYINNASDIHVEPFENETLVRMRVDGVIIDYVTLQKALHGTLIARIKILSNLDIAERRIPQDGHFRAKIEGEHVNIRVSVIPTVFGEKAVLRLLASNNRIDNSRQFGMNEESYNKFKKILQSPNGILYITGPTGSGKSTTLYMVLEEMSKRQVNIATIEDPVEKNLPRVNQMQVNNTAGLTFDVGLRALLRQDPDIIMVGETRDAETASISIRAAITGHFVLSTLHTNNAASTIVRLIDMGMEPYMISSSVVGVVAQRLVRKLCPNCKKQAEMTEEEKAFLGTDIGTVYEPGGCVQCNNTGYKGRIAVHEILLVDYKIRDMIAQGASVESIQNYAVKEQNMHTLRQQGIEMVKEGVTSMEELLKIAYNAE